MKYYSQYDEEDFLLKYFNKKNIVILIDIGASDGKTN
jgi:hypothetical protein